MPIEALWTGAASIGAAVAFWNLRAARLDLQKLNEVLGTRANGELIIARGWVRDEIVRFIVQLAWVISGVVVIAVPFLREIQGENIPPLHAVVVPLLLLTNFLVMYNTVMNARDRISLKRHWLGDEAGIHGTPGPGPGR